MKSLVIKLFGTKKDKKAFDFTKIESVLLKPIGDAIGDAVVHISHLEQIKRALPNVQIAVLVTKRNQQLFSQASVVDFIFENKASTYLSQRNKWDLYLDFQPTFTTKSIVLDKILNPKFIINFGKKQKQVYNLDSVKNYDFTTEFPNQIHFADYLNYSVFSSFLEKNQINYNLDIPYEKYDSVEAVWHQSKIKLLLNPQGSMREIPTEELSTLLSMIDSEYWENISCVLTNTTNSEEYLAKLEVPFQVSLAPQNDILGYCALVNSADLVIAVDGGGVHISCALGKRLLSFYANHTANIARWYPKPKKGTETFMVVSNKWTENNNNTSDFPLVEAAKWLNSQFAKLSEK
ncbi:lipopolysaccharide heptosyltransferase family protein [Mannheimia varigena]|uniref:glycosyltransferase family 9 protein n=1 Tax=Mannheimia varigena TaxID=85404 RepID=UPI000DBF372D|nr:glycosyltransferase family 9 protein [Mannheimia varigena]AWW34991.1 lipopolysaccharide heptosyltransferase family protein [Mannheimia varigena]